MWLLCAQLRVGVVCVGAWGSGREGGILARAALLCPALPTASSFMHLASSGIATQNSTSGDEATSAHTPAIGSVNTSISSLGTIDRSRPRWS